MTGEERDRGEVRGVREKPTEPHCGAKKGETAYSHLPIIGKNYSLV